jgi:lantibiotic biosynthesis protein
MAIAFVPGRFRSTTNGVMTLPHLAASSRPRWTPILKGADASRATAAIASIARDLEHMPIENGTIAMGSAGIALFFGYLAKVDSCPAWFEAGQRLLANAVSTPLEHERRFSFMSGMPGIAWSLAHLRSIFASQFAGFDHIGLEEALLTYVKQRPWQGVHDHSHGLAGCGLYALERLPGETAHAILESVVDRLNETALRLQGGATWWTPPQVLPASQAVRYPRGGFNMGPAHGIPSVIAFLAQVCSSGIATRKARPLLDDAVRWLLSQRNDIASPGCFAAFLPLEPASEPRLSPALTRWCYGDLGVSAALYYAACSVNQPKWEGESLTLARLVAGRTTAEADLGVRDACICHGAAGNGHIFNRFYQSTGEPVFLKAAIRWFRHALNFYTDGRGIGGFQAWGGRSKAAPARWHDLPGIFGGAAGVGLALLGAVHDIEPNWDATLMVSMPPARRSTLAITDDAVLL